MLRIFSAPFVWEGSAPIAIGAPEKLKSSFRGGQHPPDWQILRKGKIAIFFPRKGGQHAPEYPLSEPKEYRLLKTIWLMASSCFHR